MRGEGGATFPSLTTRAGWIPLGLACLESRPLINYSVDRAVSRRRRTAERTLRQPEAVSRAIKCAVLLFPSPTHDTTQWRTADHVSRNTRYLPYLFFMMRLITKTAWRRYEASC